MSIFAQHGWGKSDKIERGLADGSIDGLIMSPRDETPENLAAYLGRIAKDQPTAERLVDPQLHIGSVWPVNAGKLPRYDHYKKHVLSPIDFSPQNIQQMTRSTLRWQRDLDISTVLAPTVMVDDLSSRWAQIAMMLAQEATSQYGDSRPLLLSLVVGEDALRHRGAVDDWLDELTRLDVDGFYLIVRRSSEQYKQQIDADVLVSLLRVCYSLGELNQYRILCGYTDMVTLLLHAVGIAGSGSGWFAGLRQFTLRRFRPRTGGRQPRPRYSSTALLNSIYISELDGIYNAGGISEVLSGTDYDTRFSAGTNPENVAWPNDDAALHHWNVLANIARSVEIDGIEKRLNRASELIAHARATYAQTGRFVPFATETGSAHLDQWLDALRRFKVDVGL